MEVCHFDPIILHTFKLYFIFKNGLNPPKDNLK